MSVSGVNLEIYLTRSQVAAYPFWPSPQAQYDSSLCPRWGPNVHPRPTLPSCFLLLQPLPISSVCLKLHVYWLSLASPPSGSVHLLAFLSCSVPGKPFASMPPWGNSPHWRLHPPGSLLRSHSPLKWCPLCFQRLLFALRWLASFYSFIYSAISYPCPPRFYSMVLSWTLYRGMEMIIKRKVDKILRTEWW